MNFSNSYSKRVKVLWQRIQVKITNETRNLSPYLLQISDILIIMDRMFIFPERCCRRIIPGQQDDTCL